jgi:hypothetical protein
MNSRSRALALLIGLVVLGLLAVIAIWLLPNPEASAESSAAPASEEMPPKVVEPEHHRPKVFVKQDDGSYKEADSLFDNMTPIDGTAKEIIDSAPRTKPTYVEGVGEDVDFVEGDVDFGPRASSG